MRAKRITLYLNPDREEERRTLDYLQYARQSNSKAIAAAVTWYLDHRDRESAMNDRLLREVRDTIRSSLQGVQSVPADASSVSGDAPVDDQEDQVDPLEFLEAFGCLD